MPCLRKDFRKGPGAPKRRETGTIEQDPGGPGDASKEEYRMKKIVTVTILGTLAAWVFLLAACGSSGKQVQQEESPKVEAPRPQVDPEAAVIEVEVAEGRRCYEEGDLQQAARIVNGILARRPQHAGANALNEKLRAVPFCTVYPGDTLGVIAGYYYRDPKQWGILARANGISDPKKLKAYQRLRIPPLSQGLGTRCELDRIRSRFFGGAQPEKVVPHVVQPGERLEALAERHCGDRRLAYLLADYNHLENATELTAGSTLQIPSFSGKKRETAQSQQALEKGILACQKQDYGSGCESLASIPKSSVHFEKAKSHLERCRTEGASHYEALGDEALQASDPNRARSFYQTALEIDPEQTELRRKLDEVTDMLKAMDMLAPVSQPKP